MAPFGDTDRTSPVLSSRITARIHDAGMPKCCDASDTKAAKGSDVWMALLGISVAGAAPVTPLAMSSAHAIPARSSWRRRAT
jgi:hypothetical protein